MRDDLIKRLGKIYWDDIVPNGYCLTGRIGDIWIKAYPWNDLYRVIIEVDMQSYTDSEYIKAQSIEDLKIKISEYVAGYLLDTYFDLSQ